MKLWTLHTDTGRRVDITVWPTLAEAHAHLRALYQVPDTVADVDLMQHVADDFETYLHEFDLRLEIVVDRNPDASTDVHVYRDGVLLPLTEFDLYSVDPGYGTSLTDWNEETETEVAHATPAVGELIREIRDGYIDSEFITNEEDL